MKNKSNLKRRDFLKLAAGLSFTTFADKSGFTKNSTQISNGLYPNIFLLVLDTLSARHLSLYGYPRKTSPNIDQFAEKAIVFHNHHSTANFTTPGTASLLTGTYPWQHRAYTSKGGLSDTVLQKNIFRYLKDKYFTAAFTQNFYADKLLFEFSQYLDLHKPVDSFNFSGSVLYNRLPNEEAVAGFRAYEKFLIKRDPPRGSFFLSLLNDFAYLLRHRIAFQDLAEIFPLGMPGLAGNYAHFTLGGVMEGVISLLGELPEPFLAYIHLLPPHSPYRPNADFHKMFNDGWESPPMPRHPLGDGVKDEFPGKRQSYDEFIANLDYEFGRLLDYVKNHGLLENSYFILTSDHGELFERGHRGHSTPLLFEPLLHIPLIISTPGQKTRRDIYTNTSSIDILPTLLEISGIQIPDTIEGKVLPFENEARDIYRNIWALESKTNSTFGPMRETTLALFNKYHKLIYYQGYENYKNQYEFYDLEKDPYESENRYPSNPLATEMLGMLDSKFEKIRHQIG
jgi:arylsulfatase A-like enzyme